MRDERADVLLHPDDPSALILAESGRRDLNPRLRPWQGRTLPLSYSRLSGLLILRIRVVLSSEAEGVRQKLKLCAGACCPMALAELLFRPEAAEEFEARGVRAAFGVGRREDDADNVVAVSRAREAEQSPVGPGGARDLPLLAQVYVGLGRGEPVGAAGLDLDEAEHRAFVRDEVYLGLHLRAAAVAPDVQLEVGGDEFVAPRAQVFRRQTLAAPPEFEVRREFDRGGFEEERARPLEHLAGFLQPGHLRPPEAREPWRRPVSAVGRELTAGGLPAQEGYMISGLKFQISSL